jgi:hypothetical protein
MARPAALGHDLDYFQAARVAIPAYALTNSAGFSPATSTVWAAVVRRPFINFPIYWRCGSSCGFQPERLAG